MNRNQNQQPPFTQFSIRVPAEIDDLLERDCQNEKRSKNNQVNFILERHYESDASKSDRAGEK